jgi:hypothetical protein
LANAAIAAASYAHADHGYKLRARGVSATRRRLVKSLAGDGRCRVMSAARSRAAAMTNLARSSLALALRAIFGSAKSRAVVNLFIDPPSDGSNKFCR